MSCTFFERTSNKVKGSNAHPSPAELAEKRLIMGSENGRFQGVEGGGARREHPRGKRARPPGGQVAGAFSVAAKSGKGGDE